MFSLGTMFACVLLSLLGLFLQLIFPQMYRILFFWILEECKSQSFSLWGVQSSKNNVSVGGLGGWVYPVAAVSKV